MQPLLRAHQPVAPGSDAAPSEAAKSSDLLENLSAVHIGLPLSDLGLGLAHTFAHNSVVPALGLGMAAMHGARGAGFLASAYKQSGMRLQHRLGVAAGETLLAGGHLVGAVGGGAWSLPLLAAGTALNTVSDYRYRTFFNIPSSAHPTPEKGLLSSKQGALTGLDAALGVGYGAFAGPALQVAGVAAGIGHAVLAAGCYLKKGDPSEKHSRHSKGFGHAVLAAGHLAGAAGAGGWALAPLVGGMLITSLQDYRDR